MPKLLPPKNGIVVRMYRQGHGDCFLLALPRNDGSDNPVYVLVDCGLKPGSQAFIHKKPIGEIVKHIASSTGGQLDLVIITHEHQDHLNGIWKKMKPYFDRFTIGRAWLAWTEDPADPDANELRRRHKDTLLQLVEARQKLSDVVGVNDLAVKRVDSLLSLEFGGDSDALSLDLMRAAAADPAKSVNKQALKLIVDKASANDGVSYLSPGGTPLLVPNSTVRAFVLGPPRKPDLLSDEDPKGSEAFPDDNPHALTFAAAAAAQPGQHSIPFSRYASRYAIRFDDALNGEDAFYRNHYGRDGQDPNAAERVETLDNAAWRRIDNEWLYSAETLALKLNAGINNTSLVLAFELPTSKKVLLFAGDAQRGNWISWKDVTWQDGTETIKPRDLLGRAVLYKVGHHGSHNATLAGTASDDYANLGWMGTGPAAAEFTAMITAVNEWALTKNDPPWRHPLPSIREALVSKAQGRVLQTDIGALTQPAAVSDVAWQAFTDRAIVNDLYFDLTIQDT